MANNSGRQFKQVPKSNSDFCVSGPKGQTERGRPVILSHSAIGESLITSMVQRLMCIQIHRSLEVAINKTSALADHGNGSGF